MKKMKLWFLMAAVILFCSRELRADECESFLEETSVFSQKHEESWRKFKKKVSESENSVRFKLPRKYHTIAAQRLDFESHMSGVKAEYYRVIDDLIDEVRDVYEQYYSQQELSEKELAKALLREISGKIVIGLKVKKIKDQRLLIHAFRNRTFDCDTFSTIFISIGQALDFPIFGADIPEHFYVKWRLSSGEFINWETREFRDFPEDELIKSECFTVGVHLISLEAERVWELIREADLKTYFFEKLKEDEDFAKLKGEVN